MVPNRFRPRPVSDLGDWQVGDLDLKVYGIVADGQQISEAMIEEAYLFVTQDVPPLVAAQGDDSELGFVIVHPGETGISILAHWWIQGSVLCQHNYRRLRNADQPLNKRYVTGCVWELGLINAEQSIWRNTMMVAKPDVGTYLKTRAPQNVSITSVN